MKPIRLWSACCTETDSSLHIVLIWRSDKVSALVFVCTHLTFGLTRVISNNEMTFHYFQNTIFHFSRELLVSCVKRESRTMQGLGSVLCPVLTTQILSLLSTDRDLLNADESRAITVSGTPPPHTHTLQLQ